MHEYLSNRKKHIGMSASISRILIYTLFASILLMASISTYILWSEKKRITDVHTKSINATLTELSRQLSVPVKVGDIVGTHEIIASSALPGKSQWIHISGSEETPLFSSKPKGSGCNGQYIQHQVDYRSVSAGQLTVCLKKTEFSNSGIFWTICSVWAMFLSFILILGTMARRVTRQTRDIENFIKNIDPDNIELPQLINVDSGLEPIYSQIYMLLERIKRNRQKIHRLSIYEALSQQARAVAHDIRSPLSLVKTLVKYSDEIQGRDKKLLSDAVQDIEKISNDLLARHKPSDDDEGKDIENMLSDFWQNKKIEFFSTATAFSEDIKWDDVSDIPDFVGLKRVLSNIANNAVEAVSDNPDGQVSFKSYQEDNQIFLEISDNGEGIDPQIVSSLGKKEVTLKEDGNGIGLLNAKKYLDSVKGQMKIFSNNEGTLVQLTLPAIG